MRGGFVHCASLCPGSVCIIRISRKSATDCRLSSERKRRITVSPCTTRVVIEGREIAEVVFSISILFPSYLSRLRPSLQLPVLQPCKRLFYRM